MNMDYIPSNEDILKAQISTIVPQAQFQYGNALLTVSEKDDKTFNGILFVVPLDHYAYFSSNEKQTNLVDLFQEKLAEGNSLRMCFSKQSKWDGDEWDSEMDYVPDKSVTSFLTDSRFISAYETALGFILDQFLKLNGNGTNKVIYSHVTCFTNIESVKNGLIGLRHDVDHSWSRIVL
ncbi:hypothetical protein RFI_21505 [Reticulomyxa filosa]|uniref:Uncharacterized protein n=1 Tax=Reticulomyxa filosa TaxID=46433 RepID=X6MPV6_RETFI|nr:hypothetical protein RFI_21505 [Reticulomyxa filosa]|eukprot:ETO15859.1 hypothetical protein RFI_21505 [Reticulomyxa filosa]